MRSRFICVVILAVLSCSHTEAQVQRTNTLKGQRLSDLPETGEKALRRVTYPFTQSQTDLKVISFNIHGMAPGSDPSTRLAHIIQNLEQLDPDIVGLQEINETPGAGGVDNQGLIITDSLTHHFGRAYYYYNSATHLAWDNTFLESIGIISKYPILQSGFSNLAMADFPRKVVWSSIDAPAGTVHFFNTHLSTAVDVVQVQQILEYISAREQADPGVASILTGDFNDTPESEAVRLLTGNESDTTFADTYHEANPSLPGYTVPAGSASSRIDYVFSRRSGALVIKESEVVFNTPFAPGQYCSDHYGVMTTFAWQVIPRILVPSSCIFPSLLPGMEYRKVVTVSNGGLEPLEIDSITNTIADFQIVGLPQLPVSLEQGGPGLQMTITFAPTAAGSFVDTVTVTSNDPGNPRVRIALHGKCLAALAPALPGVLYAASSAQSDGFLHTIDPTTGSTNAIGPMGIPGVQGLAVRPSTHELHGTHAASDSTWLYRITTTTGDAVPTLVIKAGDVGAIAFGAQDALYGATTAGQLYRIDIADGTVSSIGSPFEYGFAGICMSPGGHTLWACLKDKTDSTYQIDPLTGEVHYVGVTGFLAFTQSLAFGADGTLYALIDNGYNVNYITTLDTATASGVTAYPTGVNSLSAIAMSIESPSSAPETMLSALPAEYALWQNYPNPFNPKTVVSYQLPVASDVRLVVFDVLGREVKTLVDERRAAGTHQETFDGTDLSSGMYICRMIAGTHRQALKMVLAK
jgi:endonuclease/exonuclease/phosphatase family metal-dependent hydrolase